MKEIRLSKAATDSQLPPWGDKRSTALMVHNGTIEAIKWLALFLMTLDHVNKYILGDSFATAFNLGRLTMPLFGFVLAYNLARPGAFESGIYQRTMIRLAAFGLVATPFFIGLGGLAFGWWPLNIMFMLLVSTGVLYLVQKGGKANTCGAVALFLIGGAFVEFWWFALAFCLAAFWYCKSTTKTALVVWCVACASLYLVNKNFWAMAAIPVALLTTQLKIQIPRVKHVFYIYYPAHLALILLINFNTAKLQ